MESNLNEQKFFFRCAFELSLYGISFIHPNFSCLIGSGNVNFTSVHCDIYINKKYFNILFDLSTLFTLFSS